jgi:regulatory protein
LVARKLRSMTRLTPEVKTRRLVGMLARKGYSPSLAFSIVRDALGTIDAETGDDDTAWLA